MVVEASEGGTTLYSVPERDVDERVEALEILVGRTAKALREADRDVVAGDE